MATTIDAVAVSRGGWRRQHSALRLADDAVKACLSRAGRRAGEVDLLVNVGIYRDGDLGEPALAALIQQDVGANPGDPHQGSRGTFSFDLSNGPCGVLNALQVADGFLRAGTIRHALVSASDADPGHRVAVDFPFAATGGALLLGWSEGPGLTGFRSATEPGTEGLFRATLALEHGRNRMRVHRSADFADVAVRWAAKVAGELLAERELAVRDVDLVVLNPLAVGAGRAFAGLLGTDAAQVVCAEADPPPHTSGLIASYAAAEASGQLAAARRVLLVTAGAGVTAAAAVLER